jgi:hypothetical protein
MFENNGEKLRSRNCFLVLQTLHHHALISGIVGLSFTKPIIVSLEKNDRQSAILHSKQEVNKDMYFPEKYD